MNSRRGFCGPSRQAGHESRVATEVEEADLPTRKITVARSRFILFERFSNSPWVDPMNSDDVIPFRRFGQINCEKIMSLSFSTLLGFATALYIGGVTCTQYQVVIDDEIQSDTNMIEK
jgi:hypothetical protein